MLKIFGHFGVDSLTFHQHLGPFLVLQVSLWKPCALNGRNGALSVDEPAWMLQEVWINA